MRIPLPQRRASRPFARARLRLALLSLALLLSLVLFLQFTLLPSLVRKPLERALGGSVRITRVSFSLAPAIVIHNLRIIAPGVPGDASRLLHVKAIRIKLDASDLLNTRITPTSVTLHQPHLRISQHLDTGAVNAASLSPSGRAGAPSMRFPQMEIRNGTIALAEHSVDRGYNEFLLLPIEGAANPDPDNPSRCAFTLLSQPTGPSSPSMRISGFFDIEKLSAELALSNFTFGDFADLWTPSRTSTLRDQLDISGRIPTATLSYSPETGPVATFVLEGVGINLPVPEQPGPSTPPDLSSITADTFAPATPRLLRMVDVSGQIAIAGNTLRAELVGAIADVRYRAVLSTKALSLSAPFRLNLSTATPFSLRQRAAILPFAPPIVHERLRTFSGPTAVVDAQVLIERPDSGSADAPAPLSYSGLLTFRDGRAAFEDFPYPFSNLSGVVRFNDSEIRIEKITGTHPSGAKLLAEGTITPPSEDGKVDLHITAVNVPLDAEFTSCLPPDTQPIMDAVFDAEVLDRLSAQALLPVNPPFRLAGAADIDVFVHRPLGPDQEWTADVKLHADETGILARAFPFPSIARDISVLIRAGIAEINISRIEPVAGGEASLRGSVQLPNAESNAEARPSLSISARDIPITPLLFDALDSGIDARDPVSAERPGAGVAILRRLHPEGLLDAEASIHPAPDGSGELDYNVRLRLNALVARPAPDGAAPSDGCSIIDISGDIEITPRQLKVANLTGRILTPQSMDAGGFSLALELSADSEQQPRPDLRADITTTNIDLGAPIENIIAAVVPEDRRQAATLRRELDPKGRIDANVALRSSSDRERVLASATLNAARDASFTTPFGRLALTSSSGAAAIDDAQVRFDTLSGALTLDTVQLGAISLRGALALNDAAPSDLHIAFQSDELAPDTLQAIIETLNKAPVDLRGIQLGGAFHVEAAVNKPADSADTRTSLAVRPRSFTVESGDESLRFEHVSGSILARNNSIRFEQLWARSPDLTLLVDGVIDPLTGPDLRFSADADCLSPTILSLIPDEPREAMIAMGLDIRGPLTVRNARLTASVPSSDAPLHFSGSATFVAASADVGLALSHARGSLQVEAAPPLVDLELNVDECKVAGLSVRNADASIHANAEQRSIVLSRATAASHAGQVSVEAAISPSNPDDFNSPPAFDADITLFGLAFGPALQELRQQWPSSVSTTDGAPPDRGLLDAYIALSGRLDDPHSRIGRGAFRITQGKIISFPIINRLIEVSNLSLPLDSPLDEAHARFYMQGQRVTFERLNLASDAITIVGAGDILFPDMNLDLQFTSRSNLRIPLITDLFEALRNEIITTTVVGPVTAPKVAPSAFTGTRDLLDDLFSEPSPREAPTLRPDQ